jgi:hypothetical protein
MSYYKTSKTTVKEIVKRWMEGEKIYDSSMPLEMDIEDLWNFRDYSWTKETARSGFGHPYSDDEESITLPGPEKWDVLKNSLKVNGWFKEDALTLFVGKDGRAKVGEGNHRLAIARELKFKTVPVNVIFYQNTYQTSEASYTPRVAI